MLNARKLKSAISQVEVNARDIDELDGGVGGQTPGTGAPGQNGLSAYDIAVLEGFVGTRAEWVASLKGDQGTPGVDGVDGVNGTNGVDGLSLLPQSHQATLIDLYVTNLKSSGVNYCFTVGTDSRSDRSSIEGHGGVDTSDVSGHILYIFADGTLKSYGRLNGQNGSDGAAGADAVIDIRQWVDEATAAANPNVIWWE